MAFSIASERRFSYGRPVSYDQAIQRSPAAVAYSTLAAARERAHVFLLEVVARVIGTSFNSEVPAQVEARGQVLSVLFRALETAAERRRNRAAASRRRRQREDGTGEGDDGTGETGGPEVDEAGD